MNCNTSEDAEVEAFVTALKGTVLSDNAAAADIQFRDERKNGSFNVNPSLTVEPIAA